MEENNLVQRQNQLNNEIVDLIHAGKSTREIKELLKNGLIDEGVKYSESQAYNLIYVIKKQITKEFNEAKEDLTAEIVDKLNNLYEKSYSIKDYKECREILRDLSKMIGLGQNQVTVAKQDELIQINFN